MSYFQDYPSQDQLKLDAKWLDTAPLPVNAHIHTPYSFSSFTGLEQAFEMAVNEDIVALGINDFYVTDGYEAFIHLAHTHAIFPLLNIEAIALSKELQEQGIRVNDPGNPGRTYICGKGLDYPPTLSGEYREMLENVKRESQRQIVEMLGKLNVWLKACGMNIDLTYDGIRSRFARRLVRERHIAQALRCAIFENYADDAQRSDVLRKIYGGRPSDIDIQQDAALENELRNNLLKAGAKAFVPEDEKAFLTIDQIRAIILAAGGIPCYPVLLDGASGKLTEFEADSVRLHQRLLEWGIRSIELIPQRNSIEIMEPFVRYFYENGFTITFGTEHNAPGMIPLTPCCKGNTPLTDFLRRVNYEGACVIAAHQYLRSTGSRGFLDENGEPQPNQRDSMVQLGNAVIKKWRARRNK